jgi:hypothetical protein
MNFKLYSILFVTFCFQITFSQKTIDKKYEKARELFNEENFHEADSLIKEVKKPYKTVPPKVAYLEILIKDKLIQSDAEIDFALIEETKKLVANYKIKFIKYQNDNYKEVVKIGNELNKYPKSATAFYELKAQKEKEKALEKELLEKQALAAKQKAEADRIKQIEIDRVTNLVNERKSRLRPYKNPETFTNYELSNMSTEEFNELLNNSIIENKQKIEQEQNKKFIESVRLEKLGEDKIYVDFKDLISLCTISDSEFDEIYLKAKKDSKNAKRNQKMPLGPFSSIGFQSGEIAKYGLIYERGGRNTFGFRITARTSLTSENDLLNQIETKNKTEIELGPNIKIFKRLFWNIGVGYGFYNRITNNDYANILTLEKTGYSVATSGLMFRLTRVISINGGASFMDIEKDFYKPEITFGISFNLKRKYSF